MPTKSISRVAEAIRLGRLTFSDYLRIVEPQVGPFCEWQIEDMLGVVRGDIAVLMRTRRGGKTRDMTLLAVWYTIKGRNVLWYAPTSDQRDAAVQYFLRNPFVADVTRNGQVRFRAPLRASLRLSMLTMGKTAGGSADVIFYDELGKVVIGSRMYEFWLYSEAVNVATRSPRTVYGSTPYLNSAFAEVVEVLSDKTSVHTVDDVLALGEHGWINADELERLRRQMPDWAFRQEFYCEFVAPNGALVDHGRILTNPPGLVNPIEAGLPVSVGVDFNGPNTGHYVVVVAIDRTNDVLYIVDERIVHSVDELVALQRRRYPTALWEIETGLFNDEFVRECVKKGLRARTPRWDESRIISRVYALISFENIVFVREGMFTERDLRRMEWDGPKPKKRRDQHAFDALLHALVGADNPEKIVVGGKVLNSAATFNIL